MRRWHWLWLAPLVLLLAAGAEWLAARAPDLGEQATVSNPAKSAPRAPRTDGAKPDTTARLIPVYPAGSLPVERPRPKPVATKAPAPAAPQTEARPALRFEGERPALEIAYEEIGFERYLRVVERIGRLFILVERDGALALGPGVSLSRGTLVEHSEAEMADLAVTHPHLIADARIADLLILLDLPPGAVRDRVVLLLTKPFDEVLWDAIADAVSRHGIGLADVERIRGAYAESPSGSFLMLDEGIARRDGQTVALGRRLRVTL